MFVLFPWHTLNCHSHSTQLLIYLLTIGKTSPPVQWNLDLRLCTGMWTDCPLHWPLVQALCCWDPINFPCQQWRSGLADWAQMHCERSATRARESVPYTGKVDDASCILKKRRVRWRRRAVTNSFCNGVIEQWEVESLHSTRRNTNAEPASVSLRESRTLEVTNDALIPID